MKEPFHDSALRIALVEDDAQLAELVSLWLAEAGHACRRYESGKPFLKDISRRETFDLLLLDWNLPDISGDEILITVRRELDWHIPVLFSTSRDSEEDIVHALELGADDYMVKPIRRGELVARIGALVRRSEAWAIYKKKSKRGISHWTSRNDPSAAAEA